MRSAYGRKGREGGARSFGTIQESPAGGPDGVRETTGGRDQMSKGGKGGASQPVRQDETKSNAPLPPSQPSPPLRPSDAHQQFLVLDRYPGRQHLHRVLEVGIEEDLARAVDQGGGRGV